MRLVKHFLPTLGGGLAVGALFAVVICLPLPGWIGAKVRYGFGLWLIVFALLFYYAYRYNKSWAVVVLVSLFCALSLSGLWVNKSNDLQVLSGFVFFSDAAQYYTDALRLLAGFSMSAFSGRHPLSTVFFGTLLWFVNGNLQVALILLAMIVAFCIIILGDSVSHLLGPVAAASLVTLLLLFCRRFTGVLNSEQLGFTLGCLSLAFLLWATSNKDAWIGIVGVLFLGLAVAVRPGAFLILFFAPVWVAQHIPIFPNKWLASLSVGMLAAVVGFILIVLCNSLLAEKGTVAFSNYSYSLYGMVFGNRGWEQFAVDHPDTLALPAPQVEAIAFHETFQAIKADPFLGLRGWSSSWLGYFTVGSESLYGFVASGETASLGKTESIPSQSVYILVRLTLYALTIFGVWSLWCNKELLSHSLLFWCGMATLLGVSYIPAHDAGMMRIHAASLPYLLCLPAMGLASLFRRHTLIGQFRDRNPQGLFAYGLLVFLLAGIPLFTLSTRRPADFSNVDSQCGADQVSVIVEMNRGGYVKIIRDDGAVSSGYPVISHTEFLEKVNGFYRAGLLTDLAQIPPETILTSFLDLRTGQSGWLILPPTVNPAPGDVMEVCGNWHPGLLLKGLGFLQAKQTYIVSFE